MSYPGFLGSVVFPTEFRTVSILFCDFLSYAAWEFANICIITSDYCMWHKFIILKMVVLWDIVWCSVVGIERHIREAYCLYCQTAWCNIPEDMSSCLSPWEPEIWPCSDTVWRTVSFKFVWFLSCTGVTSLHIKVHILPLAYFCSLFIS